MVQNFDHLIESAKNNRGKRLIVVFPNNNETLSAIAEVRNQRLAEVVLVGDKALITALSGDKDSLQDVEIIHQPNVRDALHKAIALVKQGKGEIILKGGVDTSTLMRAVLQEDSGLRTSRLLSDVFLFEYPPRVGNKLVMITDGGINLAPDLKGKVELINNAVEVAHALGNLNPKVAVLSSSEFVNPNLQSSVDAAVLAKMNDRGQIKGCVVDGPLALDNAVSSEAAGEKQIESAVAGKADILLLPSIESANIFAKGTTYFAGYRLAHVVIGGKIPILIPSRADKSDAKLLSIALGVVMSGFYTKGKQRAAV